MKKTQTQKLGLIKWFQKARFRKKTFAVKCVKDGYIHLTSKANKLLKLPTCGLASELQ